MLPVGASRAGAIHRLLRNGCALTDRNRYSRDASVVRPTGPHGADGGFRLRTGDWRVIYFLDNERKVLLVVKIDRRGRVYR